MQCIITGKQPNYLTYCDETKKRALNSQTVIAKENPHLSLGGPSLRQTSGTDPPIKDLSHCRYDISQSFIILDDLYKLIMKRSLSNDSLNRRKILALKCLLVEEFSSQHCICLR